MLVGGAGAQLDPADLPRGVARQLSHEDQVPGHLVAGEVGLEVGAQLLLGEGGAVAELDVADADLSQRSSRRPTTAQLATSSSWTATASTSAGYTFSPPEMNTSFTRSTTCAQPSSSTRSTSPVRNHCPSTKLAAVSSGRPQ